MHGFRNTARAVRHTGGALAEALLVAAIMAALLVTVAPISSTARMVVGTANAATTSNVWVVELSTGRAATAGLPYGSHFTVGYATSARQPWAHVRCYANSSTLLAGSPDADGSIWGEWYSVYTGGPSPQNFVLGDSVSPVWMSGGADCVVELVKLSGKYNGALGFSNVTVLATSWFAAVP